MITHHNAQFLVTMCARVIVSTLHGRKRVVRSCCYSKAEAVVSIKLNSSHAALAALSPAQLAEARAPPRPHTPVGREGDTVAFATCNLRIEAELELRSGDGERFAPASTAGAGAKAGA